MERIGNYAFSGSSSLKLVQMGNGVHSIGTSAFSSTAIESVYIKDLAAWCRIAFENETANPLWAGSADLYINGEKLTNLSAPEELEIIPFATFGHCNSLESVSVPDGTIAIGSRAFQECMNLKCVTLPASMSRIEAFAFSGCEGLRRVDCYAITPPELSTGWNDTAFNDYFAFTGIDFSKVVLHVPHGCEDAYSAAPGWNRFGAIIEDLEMGIETVSINDESEGHIYKLNGVEVVGDTSKLLPGIYLKRQNGSVRKIVVR